MTNADIPYLAKILAVFSSVFNEPVDELKAEGYFAALKDLPLEAVREAAHAAIKTDNFFPRPARLRELVTGSSLEQADAAWAKLLQQIRWEGYTGKPQLSDATWEVVSELWGSWVNLCQTLPGEGPELQGWQKRFKASYASGPRVSERLQLSFDASAPPLEIAK